MKDVSNNHNPTALQRLRHGVPRREKAGKREQIQQTLTGMAVKSIAPIEHHGALAHLLQVMRQLLRDTRGTVAHHQHIGPHGHVGARRVENAFPFAE